MHIKNNLSPNYSPQKRPKNTIKMIVIHYTGMQSERESLKHLCNPSSKVSCHYLINKNGTVYRLVKEQNIAWHAGKSQWKQFKNLNKNSIGIEMVNKGHEWGYSNFSKSQINKLISLCIKIKKKYKIKKNFILGHSDIAPTRKKDPGEKFPWQKLANHNLGLWHNKKNVDLQKLRKKYEPKNNKIKKFYKNLKSFGYFIPGKLNNLYKKNLLKAFQRHYRKDLINGKLDLECAEIASNLLKKHK